MRVLAAALSLAFVVGCGGSKPAFRAQPVADPCRAAIHAVAATHDALIHAPSGGDGALLAAGSGRLTELTQAIVATPAPSGREQRYVLARVLAYSSSATVWVNGRMARATLAAGGAPTDSVAMAEAATGLDEAYDLLAASEKRFLRTAVLWDRLRVKRRGVLAVDAADLKRRMGEADDAVVAEFEGFD